MYSNIIPPPTEAQLEAQEKSLLFTSYGGKGLGKKQQNNPKNANSTATDDIRGRVPVVEQIRPVFRLRLW